MPFGGLLTAGIGAAGSLFGGLFGANASGRASQQYINALKQAQGWLQGQEAQGLGNYQPYLNAGGAAAGMLTGNLSQLTAPWTGSFQAPTAAQAAATPGYQFTREQGLSAAENSAAARGGLLSGGTLSGLTNYAEGLASTNYQNTFNNALTQYNSAYQTFLNNQQNAYSRLMGTAGLGLGAAGGAGGLITGIGGDIASLYGQQGAAAAGGTLGSANSILGMIPGLTGSLSQIAGGFGGGGGFNYGNPSPNLPTMGTPGIVPPPDLGQLPLPGGPLGP